MYSAFGVEHGEVSKVSLKLPPKGPKGITGVTGRLTRAQVRTKGLNYDAETRPAKVKRKLNEAGETPISIKGVGRATSRGTKRIGRFIERHPGASGTAILGGGTYAGYRMASGENRKRHREGS